MWPSAVASGFSRKLVMLFSVKLGHVENFPLFYALNRVYFTGINIALVGNSNISCKLISDKTALIFWSLMSLQIRRWHLYSFFGASSSLSLQNMVFCSLYTSIACLPLFMTLILVIFNVIVHTLSERTGNDTRFWVGVGNLNPLWASLFKVDTFISACKVNTIWYPYGCTACNREVGKSLSMGVYQR